MRKDFQLWQNTTSSILMIGTSSLIPKNSPAKAHRLRTLFGFSARRRNGKVDPMIETPQIIQTTSLPTAILPVTVSWQEMGAKMGPGIAELLTNITAQGVAPAGEIFIHHLRRPTETFDFEISVPVASPVKAIGRIRPGEWPALTMARTVYQGPYEGLGEAWPEFFDWVEKNGHKTTDELWESYLVGPRSNPDPMAWRTELSLEVVDGIITSPEDG